MNNRQKKSYLSVNIKLKLVRWTAQQVINLFKVYLEKKREREGERNKTG